MVETDQTVRPVDLQCIFVSEQHKDQLHIKSTLVAVKFGAAWGEQHLVGSAWLGIVDSVSIACVKIKYYKTEKHQKKM